MEQWNSDVWDSANSFLNECSELLGDLRYSVERHLPVINPSGRFQDPSIRQLQSLIHQVELSISNRKNSQFLSDSLDLLDYMDVIEVNSELFRDKFNRLEILLEVSEFEIIYEVKKILEPSKSIILCNDNLLDVVSRNPYWLYSMSSRDFEEMVAEIFFKYGFNVELTAATRDGGKDIIAIKNDMDIPTKYLIECKRYRQDRKVTLDIVQRLYGVCYSNKANKGLVVTTSSFTRDAYKFASLHPWELDLKDYENLLSWIRNIPKSNQMA